MFIFFAHLLADILIPVESKGKSRLCSEFLAHIFKNYKWRRFWPISCEKRKNCFRHSLRRWLKKRFCLTFRVKERFCSEFLASFWSKLEMAQVLADFIKSKKKCFRHWLHHWFWTHDFKKLSQIRVFKWNIIFLKSRALSHM